MLQRGRAQLSAEFRDFPSVVPPCVVASTGPRSIERGVAGHTAGYDAISEASTGPRSIERGV